MFTKRRMSVVDRIGERHGRLVVLDRAENHVEPSGSIRARWRCRCDCGNEIVTYGKSLAKGTTKSCGCITKEMRQNQTTHGLSRSDIYRIWNSMRQRCTNPNSTQWASYGGRGITVCDRWMTFENFFEDMSPRPNGATLERKDNERGYEPGNVIWASRLVQANNRRTNIVITLGDESHTIAEWGRITGLGKAVIAKRLNGGWSTVKALTTQIQDTGRRRRK